MRLSPGKVIVPLLLVGLVAAIVMSILGRETEVDAATVVRGPVRSTVEEEARARVADRFVLSCPVAGRLLRVEVLEGQTVEKGDVLARLDSLERESRLIQARARLDELERRIEGVDRRRPKEAELERAALRVTLAEEGLAVAQRELDEAKATLANATRDAGRMRKLHETGTITTGELEDAELAETCAQEDHRVKERRVSMARLARDVAKLEEKIVRESGEDFDWEEKAYRAQLESARAEIEILQDELRRLVLRSPVKGTVLRRHQESEAVLAAGTPILEVGDTRKLEVEADLLSEDAARIRKGQPVEVFGRALGDAVRPGEVVRIHPGAFKKISSLGVEQQRVTVVASFDACETTLGDGYRVHLRVLFDESENALLVPEGALFRREGRWAVFRIEDGRARLAPLVVGLGDGRNREVREGLAEGDRVILYPGNGLEEGSRVSAR
jgi:HlyD family secretion protein